MSLPQDLVAKFISTHDQEEVAIREIYNAGSSRDKIRVILQSSENLRKAANSIDWMMAKLVKYALFEIEHKNMQEHLEKEEQEKRNKKGEEDITP